MKVIEERYDRALFYLDKIKTSYIRTTEHGDSEFITALRVAFPNTEKGKEVTLKVGGKTVTFPNKHVYVIDDIPPEFWQDMDEAIGDIKR